MATLQEINDIIAAIQFRPPPPVDPVFVNSLLPLTFDQAVNSVQADGYTQNIVNPVIREYQAAFGTVPDQAGLQFWVQQFGTGQVSLAELSFTFASSQQFFNTYGVGPTAPPTTGLITALYQNVLERAPDQAGLDFWLNSGLNASQLLEEFAQSGEFIQNTNPNIIAFQNAEVAGNPPVPPTSLFDVETTGFTLTTGVDTFIETVDSPVFNAPPGANALGPSNTLNTGDNVESTAGNGTLNYTAVASPFGNPSLATGVTLTGVSTANISNTSFGTAGFSGNVTGLTNVNVQANSVGDVLLGLAGAPLATALETVSLNASQDFTAWMANTALAGNADSLQLNLNSVADSFDERAFINVNVNAGTNGYEEINITSTGPLANAIDLDSEDANGVDVTTTALINVNGEQDLDITGDVLDVANLETFDGSNATGDLTVGDVFDPAILPFGFDPDQGFFGFGDVVVIGGSGDDYFTFNTLDDPATAVVEGAVDVSGNDGDDIFTFFEAPNGNTTFTDIDVADGGAGLNRLRLEVETGAILAAGVGPNILNIQTIQHFGEVDGNLTADMARSGSATTLELLADYDNNNVVVDNLTDADTVVYDGDDLDFLTLNHVSAVGTVNLTMSQTELGGVLDIDDLVVPNGIILNLVSTGNADLNSIDDVDQVDTNVRITGAVDLEFGSLADPYDFDDGIIDAALFTGDLTVFIGNNSQTVIGGIGNDTIHVVQQDPNEPDFIDLTVGGNDTVVFHDTNGDDDDPVNENFYTFIDGFDIANDTIAIDVTGPGLQIDLQQTNGPDVDAGDALSIYPYTTNIVDNLSGVNINFIKIDTPQTSIGFDLDSTFDFAMGTGSIDVAGGADLVLMAFHDANAPNGGQMVLFTVEPDSGGTAGEIDAGDDVQLVSLIGMTKADFDAFGASNLTFV